VHVVRFGRLVWLIGTNLEHLYRFRYTQMIRRPMLMTLLRLLRGVCAVWARSDVFVSADCAGFAVMPMVVSAEHVSVEAHCSLFAALVPAAECCVWVSHTCHQDRPLLMMRSQWFCQLVLAQRFELLQLSVGFQ